MTPADVAAIAQQQGLEMRQIVNTSGDWAIGIRSQYRIDATFAFCAATGLFSYSHSLYPDNAYLPAVECTIAARRQPKVSVRRQVYVAMARVHSAIAGVHGRHISIAPHLFDCARAGC
ncbi:hypothetical protein [Burkholderia sp. A2]|uniref:hypothetical protein n=1 Tax=Burkholderia sp. A2 TaxID=236253 RepID=UPI00114D015A|nr:hypothetical protein [Burkholderia sp. A2]